VGSQTAATITERKTRLDGSVAEFACESLVIEPGRRAVVRYVSGREARVGDLVLAPGTVTIGHFWADRSYNVYHWIAAGRTIAYYCNLVDDTRVTADRIDYTDLTVDVLVKPSGDAMVLDEDELPDDLAPKHRLAIAKALEAIIANPRGLIREIERESAAAQRVG
jgi:predicted RNA-binding protein associated with RNAse of E/G family